MLASKSLMPYDISAQAQRLAQPSPVAAKPATQDRTKPSFLQRLAARWQEARLAESRRFIEETVRFRLHTADRK